MEPPRQPSTFLSSSAITLTCLLAMPFIFGAIRVHNSSFRRSANPGKQVEPPARIMFERSVFLGFCEFLNLFSFFTVRLKGRRGLSRRVGDGFL